MARTFRFVGGAGTARKVETTFRKVVSEPFFHRLALELATNMTACCVPLGIVTATIAFLGISVCVD